MARNLICEIVQDQRITILFRGAKRHRPFASDLAANKKTKAPPLAREAGPWPFEPSYASYSLSFGAVGNENPSEIVIIWLNLKVWSWLSTF